MKSLVGAEGSLFGQLNYGTLVALSLQQKRQVNFLIFAGPAVPIYALTEEIPIQTPDERSDACVPRYRQAAWGLRDNALALR